jgi:hypothetical protein
MEELPRLLGPIRPTSSSCHSPEPGNCLARWSKTQTDLDLSLNRSLHSSSPGCCVRSQVLNFIIRFREVIPVRALAPVFFFIVALFCPLGEHRESTRWSLDDMLRRTRHFMWAAYSAHLLPSSLFLCILIFGRPWLVFPFQYEVVRHCLLG